QNDVTAAMGEAIGIECNQRSAGDGEKAEACPGSKQCCKMRPLRNLASCLGSCQCIDDAAQQHRFGKLCGRKGNGGDRQPPSQWSLGAKQSENAPIETKNIHARRKLS